jgi:hypothetical protein
MNLRSQIDAAFASRQRPSNLVEPRSPITPEQRDALPFAGRNWREIGWQVWESHPDAFYAFVPEAFIFYLSLLLGALDAPKGELLAADALIGVLDRSPEPYHWDAFMTARFVGLEPPEYEAMKGWVLSRSGAAGAHDEDSLTRAYGTLDLLAREGARLRQLLDRQDIDL